MTFEIPTALIALAKDVQAQDNSKHITSHPQYQVRHKIKVYGSDFQDEDGAIWIDKRASEPADQNTTNLMEARYRDDYTTETTNFRRCPYKEVEGIIQTFFSEVAAQQFMRRQSHNFGGMYLYVESGYINPEWQVVRDLLLSIPTNHETN